MAKCHRQHATSVRSSEHCFTSSCSGAAIIVRAQADYPAIKAIINGTAADIDWNWGGYRAFLSLCELQVDRDDAAGWVLLAMDTTPGNTDTHEFPAKPAKWQYRAIYHAGDSRVGEWSNPVSIAVGG